MKKMNRAKLKLSDLNPHLMCVLCGGYYIDATTIVECLHSFCRSCIVKHLESSKYCPICEVQVHKTKPLINIRPDKTLQDIVYKLVPGLFANEMRKRRKFYRERPHYMKPNDSESIGEISDEKRIYVHDENITLSLDYHRSRKQGTLENSFQEITALVKSEKRYFKCPAGVTIHHLQKLVKAKYDLNDSNYKVEIFFKDQLLHEDFTLLDVWYIYLWKSKGSLDLTFKIYENIVKRQKIEEVKQETLTVEQKEIDVRLNSLQPLEKEIEIETKAVISVKTDEEIIKPSEELPQEIQPAEEQRLEPLIEVKSDKDESPSSNVDLVSTKVESMTNDIKTTESIKENGVDNKESKEVQLQISESGVMSISQIENGEVVRTVEESSPKIIDNYRSKSNATAAPGKLPKPNAEITKQQDRVNRLIPEQSKQAPKPAKPYKTIRCSPKSWNPVIPKEKLRPTLMKNSDEPKKPLKFFKMRNMPRFLGNPASGVKPMFAESTENDATERRSEEKKALKNILKIDPKTLRPIEKEEIPIISTPSTPNLLTNPFIPNNNHFLFSDPTLLHPNAGNYSSFGKSEKNNNNNSNNNNNNNHNSNSNSFNNNSSSSGNSNSNNSSNGKPSGSSRPPIQNGTFPPICFPTTEYCTNFFPYQTNFPKHGNLYPPNDKLDPLMRASRLAPFANLPAFNMAGFHASLPPSISLLLKHQSPHHHFKKANQFPDKKNCSKEESTKEMSKNCDDISLRIAVANDRMEETSKEEKKISPSLEAEKTGGCEKEKEERKSVEPKKEKSEEKNGTKNGTENESKETNKESNNDNSKEIDEVVTKTTEESTCLDVTSACSIEAKPENVGDNESKSVNDKER